MTSRASCVFYKTLPTARRWYPHPSGPALDARVILAGYLPNYACAAGTAQASMCP